MSDEEEQDIDDVLEEDEGELIDWQLPLCFMKTRHKERIDGIKCLPQSWRMKERMKTVSVALVLCLNIGVDPPDVVKTDPCARLECWIDPFSLNSQKALETIGNSLQQQYERWQPRARYKLSLDPTVEDVKKLCTSLRRNAKEERVLFHYNGHGVPRPTQNGEIWVFNKSYTQYIPLSIYDLQTWMGSPSIYVYDCSNAGLILESFKQFAAQREKEYEHYLGQGTSIPAPPPVRNCIQLAACQSNELLPMLPQLPADLFTACLTTPIKVGLRWFVSQRSSDLVPGMTLELIEKIPGQLNDRRTPLGELNWIFTAVTDTIAWNTLPREVFQKLFRQDLLVASLFRNFLLAERVMRSYKCTPLSSPKLPPTYHHHMWQAWDFAVDQCLTQLPVITKDESKYHNSSFFSEQLTAFQVWLAMGCEERDPPEQLPIVLQVLLSPVHRLRALDLLGRFLDLGPWAVSLALSVGIFPYVLKLLQGSSREIRPLMVFIWAKILAVDSTCQADLVKDGGHNYFLSVLADPYMPAEHRTMAAFVIARIIHDYPSGQDSCCKGNMIALCLEQLNDPHPMLRQWLAICLGLIWTNYDAARWCGVRDSAPEKLTKLLTDPLPEVRASAVFALGRLIANTGDRSDHANMVDHGTATTLASVVGQDGSPLVRKELVVAFHGQIIQFENNFGAVAIQFLEEDKKRELLGSQRDSNNKGWILVGQGSSSKEAFMASTDSHTLKRHPGQTHSSQSNLLSSGNFGQSGQQGQAKGLMSYNSTNSLASLDSQSNEIWIKGPIRRASSTMSFSSLHENVYTRVWKTMLNLSVDPCPDVAMMAQKVVNNITVKATMSAKGLQLPFRSQPSSPVTDPHYLHKKPSTHSAVMDREYGTPKSKSFYIQPSTPDNRRQSRGMGSPPHTPHTLEFSTKRRMFDKGPDVAQAVAPDMDSDGEEDEGISPKPSLVSTRLYEWFCSYFAQSVMKPLDDLDQNSSQHIQREWRFLRNTRVRQESSRYFHSVSKLDDQIFINKNVQPPTFIRFHPYEPHFVATDRGGVSIWNYESGVRMNYFDNGNPKTSRITSLDILNAHDLSLLLTASDDGAIRVWRNYVGNEGSRLELVTAWQALSGMIPSTRGAGAGLVTSWEQQSGTLLASGDVRLIRVWDTHREMKLQDIPTGADSCVTSIACDSVGRSLLVAGLGDGSVRIYDRRLPPSDCCVITLREHLGYIVKVFLQKGTEGNIISGSLDGDIKLWDPRSSQSLQTLTNTVPNMASFDVHPQVELFSVGSANQIIKVFDMNGHNISTIRYHDGFMGQRIGPISCLAFHPYWPYLAAGSTDSFLSVYSSEKSVNLRFDQIGL
ncbi:regulatory-associated protein of mTOR-like [Rhopilema esculentum]|uniref:regulatory-associated protein of mTOR-like n=1 Tax=Rhopilema esculentum TaxID=499914 RepID=UPI0031E1E6B8|eukprot:gene9069-16721_t